LLVVVSTTGALLVSELLLTVMGFEINPLKVRPRQGHDLRNYHVFHDENFIYDPQLIWRPKPGYGIFNAQGFRGPELPIPKLSGSFRVFAVGDSNTLGWDSRFGNWPGYLQKIIDSDGRNAVVVNAGAYGYSSFQGVLRFHECLPYDPDLVLISFGANDAHQVRISDFEYASKKMVGVGFRRFLYRFRLGKLILFQLNRKTDGGSDTLVPRVSLQEYVENLEKMIAIAKANGIQPVLLTRPYVGVSADPKKWKHYAPHYNEATREIAAKHRVLLIDIYELFNGKQKYFADESHFTHMGHRLAASYIYEALRPMIPLKDRTSR